MSLILSVGGGLIPAKEPKLGVDGVAKDMG